jgi:hypothetical protein
MRRRRRRRRRRRARTRTLGAFNLKYLVTCEP